jgi:uncharacterized protein YgbK (DUF1537 family)
MLIIADDLSGAADCGVVCVSHGLSTVVSLGNIEDEVDSDVLSIDGDTRYLEPEKAAEETAALIRRFAGDHLLFRKLDSTLRGNVASELAATLEVRRQLTGERVVVVLAPAFPAHGRTTRNGQQLFHGKPLEETESWQREQRSAQSHLPAILQTSRLQSVLLDLTAVRSGTDALRAAMMRLARVADVLICDAESDQDLRAVAEASMSLGRNTVWAGSAGLAYHLPWAAGLTRLPVQVPEPPPIDGPILFVIGSLSGVSREQVRVLTASSGVAGISIAPQVLLAGKCSPQWREYELALRNALAAGKDVVITPGSELQMESEKGYLLCAALAQMVATCADRIGALVASGGESARAVLQVLGITRLRLMGEIETGLPCSMTEGWKRTLPVLTKAGGFGTPQTLLHCQQLLRETDRALVANFSPSKG